MELRQTALAIYKISDAGAKAAALLDLATQPPLTVNCNAEFADHTPGRPTKPDLVPPHKVPRRSQHTLAGHAALMHAIAHIEFNAIDLALDAVWRFAMMPQTYYIDWFRVATEEAKHFNLIAQHLNELGYGYGDFAAHDGLWSLCYATRNDITARMALIPRTLEARGLDATPMIQRKLQQSSTDHAKAAAQILDIILQDEIGHVAVGIHWFRWLCSKNNLNCETFLQQITEQYHAPVPKPPFNHQARLLAGFTEQELEVMVRNV